MKAKKFAAGGLNLFTPAVPSDSGYTPNHPAYDPSPFMPQNSTGSGGIGSGLRTVDQGANQIRNSLGTVKEAIDQSGLNDAPLSGNAGGSYNSAFNMKKGGAVKKSMKSKKSKVSSASKRGDGCAIKGKTRGKMV